MGKFFLPIFFKTWFRENYKTCNYLGKQVLLINLHFKPVILLHPDKDEIYLNLHGLHTLALITPPLGALNSTT